jgi:ketosteroid isomerase-like protein
MSNNEEKEIIKVLQEYASSLNAIQIDLIPEFYAEDSIFMPDGLKTLTKSAITEIAASGFLKRTGFKIIYTIEHIAVNGEHAFVQATAKTSTKNVLTGDISEKTSRDFFVFCKEGTKWKIYRYIFNHVENIAG